MACCGGWVWAVRLPRCSCDVSTRRRPITAPTRGAAAPPARNMPAGMVWSVVRVAPALPVAPESARHAGNAAVAAPDSAVAALATATGAMAARTAAPGIATIAARATTRPISTRPARAVRSSRASTVWCAAHMYAVFPAALEHATIAVSSHQIRVSRSAVRTCRGASIVIACEEPALSRSAAEWRRSSPRGTCLHPAARGRRSPTAGRRCRQQR